LKFFCSLSGPRFGQHFPGEKVIETQKPENKEILRWSVLGQGARMGWSLLHTLLYSLGSRHVPSTWPDKMRPRKSLISKLQVVYPRRHDGRASWELLK